MTARSHGTSSSGRNPSIVMPSTEIESSISFSVSLLTGWKPSAQWPEAVHALWQKLSKPARAAQPASEDQDAPQSHGLTPREVAILQRLASGLSNKEIAEAIFISEGTLKWHLHNIYGKLGSKNRTGALTQARTIGAIQ